MLSQEQIDKIRDFYNPQPKGNGYIMTTPHGEKRQIGIRDYECDIIRVSNPLRIFLTLGVPCKTEQEAIAADCIVTDSVELAKAFVPELFQSIQGSKIDKRTSSYLRTCKENIKLITIEHGYDELEYTPYSEFNIWFNASKVEVGKITSGEYKDKFIATFSLQTDVDDYDITSMIFNKIPIKNDIETANILEEIIFKLEYFQLKHTFRCWECGNTSHWLDIPGTLEDKYRAWKDSYCGC